MVGFIPVVLVTAFTTVAGSIGLHKYNKGDYKEEIADPIGTAIKIKDSAFNAVANIGETADKLGGTIIAAKDKAVKGYEAVEKVYDTATADDPIAEFQKNFQTKANGENTPSDDGFDFMNVAKWGIGGVGSLAVLNWLKNKITSSDDDNESSIMPSFSTILLMGVAATAWMNKDYIMEAISPDNKVEATIANNNLLDPYAFDA